MDFDGIFFDTANYELTNKKLGQGQFGKVYVVINKKITKNMQQKSLQMENLMDTIKCFFCENL